MTTTRRHLRLAVDADSSAAAATRDPLHQMRAAVDILQALGQGDPPRVVYSRVLGHVLAIAGAERAILALKNRASGRVVVAEFNRNAAAPGHETLTRPCKGGPHTHVAETVHLATPLQMELREEPTVRLVTLDPDAGAGPPFGAPIPARGAYAVSFRWTVRWDGHILIVAPQHVGSEFRRTLELMVRHLLPAVVTASKLDSVRRAAAAVERACIARELHDGVVQQLLCADLDLEALKSLVRQDAIASKHLGRVQHRIRGESTRLRTLIRRPCAPRLESLRLDTVVRGIVQQFERDTGIAVRYQPHRATATLSPRVCGELARIIQEALVNVRRHSGATHVTVQFRSDADSLTLSVRDNGCGLRSRPQGARRIPAPRGVAPAIIHQRVKVIGGTMHISADAGGALLHVTVPHERRSKNRPFCGS